VRRKVALKVLKPGMDTAQVVGRFEAERQALALMDHPHIAKVFDGGATPQGRPFFVMELVKGVPITQYCDETGLSLGERLELFVSVCQAVQHAHQKGVIHRDIKPSNVLVTLHDGRPVPKVIDFGIAKATQGSLIDRSVFTEFRQMLGTPEYMAPEQAELSGLDIDTRADIYSLGVLLYELLTGTRPFELKTLLQAGYAEMVRTIREVDPPKPSTRASTLGDQLLSVARHRKVHPRSLSTAMRGDLDWIAMKALEKERIRRYDSASALADDVLRHLRDEPVLAGAPSRLYRPHKYVRRHRIGVAAGAAIAAALVVGATASMLGWREARAQTEVARTAEARALLAFNSERTQRQRAERGEEQAREAERQAEQARAEEQRQKEAALAAQAEARREAAKANEVVDLVTTMLSSSDPDEDKGRDYPVRLVLADFERSLGRALRGDPEVEAALRHVVAHSYIGLGMLEQAGSHLRRYLEVQRSVPGTGAGRCVEACALGDLAQVRRQQGQAAPALSLLDEAAATLPSDAAEVTRTNVSVRLMLERAGALLALERLAEAEETARSVLELARSQLGDAHPRTADCMRTLASILRAR
jgi:tetratricopeptide (TPR) repeat protein